MMKKISKVIVYYEDGTYEEIKASVSDTQDQPNKKDVSPSPITWPPYTSPYYAPYTAPYTAPSIPWPGYKPGDIWCTNTDDNVPLKYTISPDSGTWSFTSTGNFGNDNKYTITSTGNGNVDLSK